MNTVAEGRRGLERDGEGCPPDCSSRIREILCAYVGRKIDMEDFYYVEFGVRFSLAMWRLHGTAIDFLSAFLA